MVHLWSDDKLLEIIAKHHYMSSKLHDISTAEYLNKLSTVAISSPSSSIQCAPYGFWLIFRLPDLSFLSIRNHFYPLHVIILEMFLEKLIKIQSMPGKHKCRRNEIIWVNPRFDVWNRKLNRRHNFVSTLSLFLWNLYCE